MSSFLLCLDVNNLFKSKKETLNTSRVMALMRFAYIQIQRISTLTKPSLNLVNSTNIHIIGLEVQILEFIIIMKRKLVLFPNVWSYADTKK